MWPFLVSWKIVASMIFQVHIKWAITNLKVLLKENVLSIIITY